MPTNVHTLFDSTSSKAPKRDLIASTDRTFGGANVHTLGDTNDKYDSKELPPMLSPIRKKSKTEPADDDDDDFQPSSSSDSSSEGSEGVPDERSLNGEGQPLGIPDMEEVELQSDEYEEEDEEGNIIIKKKTAEDKKSEARLQAEKEAGARLQVQIDEARVMHSRKWKAMMGYQHVDGLKDKDKAEEEVTGVEEWGEDPKAKWFLQPAPNGTYEFKDDSWKAVKGGGGPLRRVRGRAHKDGAFRVQPIDD